MARIRMIIKVRNDTGESLTLTGQEHVHGSWTDPWYPPATIAVRSHAEFRSEGSLAVFPTTGTEGRVRYRVGSDPADELYIHWNSPLVESQYRNTFHVWCPPGYEVAHWGGQGNRATLDIRLRPTARRQVPGFSPRVSGFRFSNSWSPDLPVMTIGELWEQLVRAAPEPVRVALGLSPVPTLPVPLAPFAGAKLTDGGDGLCGGMVFAVLDYWHAGRIPPTDASAPTARDHPLFRYIRNRLVDSFDFAGRGHRWLAYSSPVYPNGDEGFIQLVGLARGRSWVTYREEWPRIRDDIDGGSPSPIGLVQTDGWNIGKNHQVLAYAYQQRGQVVDLFVYDPNVVGREVRLTFDITDTAGAVHVTRDPPGDKHIYCIFRMDGYQPKAPVGDGTLDSVRDLLELTTSRRGGSVAAAASAAGRRRPVSVRDWLRSVP